VLKKDWLMQLRSLNNLFLPEGGGGSLSWVIIKYRTSGLEKLCEILLKLNIVLEYRLPIIKDAERKSGERYAFFNYAFVKVEDLGEFCSIRYHKRFPLPFAIKEEISEEEVERVCGVVESLNRGDFEEQGIKVGELVTIKNGPFANFTGEIVEVGRKKCKMKIRSMGREVNITISMSHLV